MYYFIICLCSQPDQQSKEMNEKASNSDGEHSCDLLAAVYISMLTYPCTSPAKPMHSILELNFHKY